MQQLGKNDELNGSTSNKEIINPDPVQLHENKMDPNPINPTLPPTAIPFNEVVNVAFEPKICLKTPLEIYENMMPEDQESISAIPQ